MRRATKWTKTLFSFHRIVVLLHDIKKVSLSQGMEMVWKYRSECQKSHSMYYKKMNRCKSKVPCFRKRHGTSADMFNPYIRLCDNTHSSTRAHVPQDGGAILTDVIYFGRPSSQAKRTINISESVFSPVFSWEGGEGEPKFQYKFFSRPMRVSWKTNAIRTLSM